MAIGSKPFRVELVTPEWAAAPMDCTFAALPAWDGEVGVLAERAPLVCKLGSGRLRLELAEGGKWKTYDIAGGFAEVLDNVLTVLASRAASIDESPGSNRSHP